MESAAFFKESVDTVRSDEAVEVPASSVADFVYGLLRIERGEIELVCLLAALFALVEAARGLGWTAADALLIHSDVNQLPYLLTLLGGTGAAILLAYIRLLSRYRVSYLLAMSGVSSALLLVGIGAIGRIPIPSNVGLQWLIVNLVNTLLGTVVWCAAAEACRSRQPDRLFPLFTGAGVIGTVAGNLLAGPLADRLAVENLISIAGILIGIGSGLAFWIGCRFFEERLPLASTRKAAGDLGEGLRMIRRSRYLQLVSVATVLLSILYFSFTWSFHRAVAEAVRSPAEIARVLGSLSAAISAATFLSSLLITSRLSARFGLFDAALIVPAAYLSGFGLLAARPSLALAELGRLVQMTVHVGIGVSAFQTALHRVPKKRRALTLCLNAGGPKQLGIFLGGLLMIWLQETEAPSLIFGFGVAAALSCAAVLWQLGRLSRGTSILKATRASGTLQCPPPDQLGTESARTAESSHLSAGRLVRLAENRGPPGKSWLGSRVSQTEERVPGLLTLPARLT